MTHARFFIPLLCVTTLLNGCSDPAKPHLERLVNDWAAVIATGYTHSDEYTRDEHRVHMHHEQSQAMSEMLDSFLNDDPPVSDDLKQMLRDWKKVNDDIAELHAAMIAEDRYVYTSDEQAQVEILIGADTAATFELQGHLEGD